MVCFREEKERSQTFDSSTDQSNGKSLVYRSDSAVFKIIFNDGRYLKPDLSGIFHCVSVYTTFQEVQALSALSSVDSKSPSDCIMPITALSINCCYPFSGILHIPSIRRVWPGLNALSQINKLLLLSRIYCSISKCLGSCTIPPLRVPFNHS